MDTQEKPETQAQNTDNPHDKGYKKRSGTDLFSCLNSKALMILQCRSDCWCI